MTISDIKAQVKTQGRYSIYVDGAFSFGLSEMGLINSGLRVGQEVSKQELEELKGEARTDKAYGQVLNLIARRPRSRWEIEDYLKRKDYDSEITNKILNMLSDRGYIDDSSFARSWVESRRLLKPISKRKLSLELRHKRINDEIISAVLADDAADEVEILKSEITRKSRQSRYQDQEKLMAYLARQGYGYGDIKQALDELESST